MLLFFRSLNHILWGIPLLLILLGTHLYFTIFLHFIQRKTLRGIRLSAHGFTSLATTLAATLGTGNIIGISTAVYLGGAGAIFWCWLTGILGMATTYAECYLSFLYRHKTGALYIGGPMYVLADGLNAKRLATFYSICLLLASFGVGCTTQANSLADAARQLFGIPPFLSGILAAVLVGLVVLGGASSIEHFCTRFVPFMGAMYLLSCLFLLWKNASFLPAALSLSIRTAFSAQAATAGIGSGVLSFSLKTAARYGIARGLFTNEAGIGSAGVAAAASPVSSAPVQALISMTATFWDTVVVCAITGLVILTHLLHTPADAAIYHAGTLTHAAFSQIPYVGVPLLCLCLILFAFATLIGWSYFGQQAYSYLFSKKHPEIYQYTYLAMIFLGATLSLELVWEMSDTLNFFLLLPNLFALYSLRRQIKV